MVEILVSDSWYVGRVMVEVPNHPEPVFVNILRSLGIDSQLGGPVEQNRSARLHRLAESIPRNRFLEIDS
jgi:hypothetical protein